MLTLSYCEKLKDVDHSLSIGMRSKLEAEMCGESDTSPVGA